jgi:hypothetical protein
LTFFVGFTVSACSVYFTATMQAFVAPEMRGRFSALRRMVSTVIVSGAAFCFAASYAKQGVRGATMTTLIINALLLSGCVAWIVMRNRSRNAVLAAASAVDTPATPNSHRAMIDEHEDLRAMFENFVNVASVKSKRSAEAS